MYVAGYSRDGAMAPTRYGICDVIRCWPRQHEVTTIAYLDIPSGFRPWY